MTRNDTKATASFVADIEAAHAAYAVATGPAKAAVKTAARARSNEALNAGRFPEAQAWYQAAEAMTTSRPAAAPVDYAALVAGRIAALELAARHLRNGNVRPAGVPDDADLRGVADLADALQTADADSGLVEAATALAEAKVARSTVRNSIADVVTRAFDATDKDTLTIAEIARLGATDDYKPGSGAIAARMFGGTGVEGFVANPETATAPRTVSRA